jgi:hypothetical protein
MKVLDERPAGWFLLEENGTLLLDVNCSHGAFGYSWMIALDADETRAFREEGRAYLDRLAEDINYGAPIVEGSRSRYRDRNVTETYGARANHAVAAWRSSDGAR